MNGKRILTAEEGKALKDNHTDPNTPELARMDQIMTLKGGYNSFIISENDQKIEAKLIELLSDSQKVECSFCGGLGHSKDFCGARKTLTRMAKDMGITFNFGMLKGLFYEGAGREKPRLLGSDKVLGKRPGDLSKTGRFAKSSLGTPLKQSFRKRLKKCQK